MPDNPELTRENVDQIRGALISVLREVDVDTIRKQASARRAMEEPVIICVSACAGAVSSGTTTA